MAFSSRGVFPAAGMATVIRAHGVTARALPSATIGRANMIYAVAVLLSLGLWYVVEDAILRASSDPSRLAPLFAHKGFRRKP